MRYLLFFISFFLAACSISKWQVDNIVANKEYESSKLSFQTTNNEIEFIKTNTHLYAYVNSFFKIITSPVIDIKIGDENFSYTCKLHDGKQKLLLPREAINKIIAGLNIDENIYITIDNDEFEIESENFKEKFQKFNKQKTVLDNIMDHITELIL